MPKRCVYCKNEITDDRALDVCDKCGYGVWGDRMFKAILNNMNNAKENDDLCSTNLDPKRIDPKKR
jgi:hypothetical protein